MHPNDPTAADAAAPEQQATPAIWAIVELMGHQRVAGRISQQTFGGAALIRVDVPEVVTTGIGYIKGERVDTMDVIPAHTRSLGAASIYGINWVDEAAATLAAHTIKHQPINPYNLKNVLADMPEQQRQKVLALAAPNSVVAVIAATAPVALTSEASDDHPL